MKISSNISLYWTITGLFMLYVTLTVIAETIIAVAFFSESLVK